METTRGADPICLLDATNLNDDMVAIASHVANSQVVEVALDQLAPGQHPVADRFFRIIFHYNSRK